MKEAQWLMETDFGPLYLVASEKGLKGVFFKKHNAPLITSLKDTSPAVKILKLAVQQMEEYLQGKRQNFDLAFDISGTDFQKRVWNQLSQIPYGKTYSYKEIAKKIKNDKAVRAVGTANGRNPLGIIVPCHRVIAADGTLGGYAGGLEFKSKLLALEKKYR